MIFINLSEYCIVVVDNIKVEIYNLWLIEGIRAKIAACYNCRAVSF